MLAGPNPRAPRGCTCDCVSNPHFPTHGFNFVFREAYILHPGAGLAECTPFAAIPGSCLVGYSHLSALCEPGAAPSGMAAPQSLHAFTVVT